MRCEIVIAHYISISVVFLFENYTQNRFSTSNILRGVINVLLDVINYAKVL